MARVYGWPATVVDDLDLWQVHAYLHPDGTLGDELDGEDGRMLSPEEFADLAHRQAVERVRAAGAAGHTPSIPATVTDEEVG